MALKLYNETDIEAIADAIRGKNGSSDTYKVSEMADAIDDIPSGGGGISADDIAKQNISGVITLDSSTTLIGDYAFAYNRQLTGVNGNGVTTINNGAFQDCSSLGLCSFPLVTQIKASAFARCLSFITNSPDIIRFDNLANLTADNCFRDNAACKKMVFPNGENLSAFCVNMASLEIIDIGKRLSGMNYSALSGCSKLNTVILRGNALSVLSNLNTFNGTPFAYNGTGGTIYIPESLYNHLGDGTSNDYKAATNWSTLDGYGKTTWAKIEGSQYENYYADGTPISS